jgi:DNA-binding SARP family transcriptional activator/Tfp pilus assembly protein PilF
MVQKTERSDWRAPEFVMEFQVLGPVEIRAAGGTVDAGHARQRAVLAVLLLDLGHLVPADRLIDRVWGEDSPPAVRNALYGYIARLRAMLTDTPDGVTLSRRQGGYVLQADAEQLDLHRFRSLARQSTAAANDEAAAKLLQEALGLWHGPALAGVDSPWLTAVRDTLELERHAAQLDLNDARLRQGQHAVLAAELVSQAATNPADERLIGQLMLALYRCGRQADALRQFDQTRLYLADELGTDPAPQLRELHQQILHADPALAVATPGATGQPVAPMPRELPADVAPFTGRLGELTALDELLLGAQKSAAAVISAVSGTAGVGKTALAVHWAHHAADHFPDGQLHVNLRGYDPGQPVVAVDALAGFLRSLGVSGQDIPSEESERAARYRSLLAGKQMLIMLDNAATVDQVRPLLPGHSACKVLVTSRDSLAGLVARDGAKRLDLDLLPLDDAVTLLRELIGARADADPGALTELAQQCARLPLALRVGAELAAARPDVSLTDLVAELSDRQRRLDLLLADGDPLTSVRVVFSWSYDHLDTDAARAFRLVGLHPGADFDVYALAALAHTSLDQGVRLLATLIRGHLIQRAMHDRYGMHDLLRAFACDLATTESAQEEHDAVTRVFDYYLSTAAEAMDLLYPANRPLRPAIAPMLTPTPLIANPEAAAAWLDAERANLVAMAMHAADRGLPSYAPLLSRTLAYYLRTRGHYPEALVIHGCARDAANRAGDPAAEGSAVNNLGIIHRAQADYGQAALDLQQALVLYRRAGDRAGEARALHNLGNVWCRQGQYQQAAEQLETARTAFREIGDRLSEASTLDSLGAVSQLQGRYQQAGRHLRRALDLHRELGDRNGEAYALNNLGIVYQREGSYHDAAASLEQALVFFRQVGNRTGEATALTELGAAHLGLRNLDRAASNMHEALSVSRRIGDRSNEADALNGLGHVLLASGQREQALRSHSDALRLAVQIEQKSLQATGHNGIAQCYDATGELSLAREHWNQALALYTEIGAPEADEVRTRLAALDSGESADA